MKAFLLVLAAIATYAFSDAAAAQAAAAPRPNAAASTAADEAQRLQAMRQKQAEEVRIQRARERCLANRGTDCDSMAGLEEWLLLDRTRAEAVLDRIAPLSGQGSASAGSSVEPGVPNLSPYNR